MKYNLIIIGGGPAGMAAAYSAWKAGMRDILLLERLPRLGGILNQCIHLGFGLHYFHAELTGTEYAARYRKLLSETDIVVQTGSCVTGITIDRQVTYINRQGCHIVQGSSIVLATGCRERTREMLTVPGTRPAGIYSAGLAQEMINIYGVMPGRECVIIGSGDIGLIMARRMTLEGASVKAVLEIQPRLSGLVRNKVQCLDDFGIPLLLEHELLEVYGRDRVESIRFRDKKTEEEKRMDCDTLLFSVGLIPERDLYKEGKIEAGVGFYITGNADYVHGLVDDATKEAEELGKKLHSQGR